MSNGVINTFVNTDDIAADNPRYNFLLLYVLGRVSTLDSGNFGYVDALGSLPICAF